jgi:hypothetical protein
MRRVLALLSLAALAFLAIQPSATAQTDQGAGPEIFGQPVINELATRGPGGPLDEFIEIMNPNLSTTVDVSGWMVQVYNCGGQLQQVIIIPQGTVLQPVNSGLPSQVLWTIGSPSFTGGAVNQPGAITGNLPDAVAVALFNPGSTTPVDAVVTCPSFTPPPGVPSLGEGTPLPPQSSFGNLDPLGPAYGRNVIGADTNNNAFDFKLLTRSPGALN